MHCLDLAIELVTCLNEGGNLCVGGNFFLPFAIDLSKLLSSEGCALEGMVFGFVDGASSTNILILEAGFK